jgi:soluble lytic murein transglycosylase-like protein
MKYLIICISLWLTFGHQSMATDSKVTVIYKYYDANGVLHLTNKPPSSRQQVLYARSYLVQSYSPPIQLPIPLPKQKIKKSKHYDTYAPLIEIAAKNVNLPSALLHAVVKVESAYNPKAVSPKGAMGLMQLMPATAKRYGVKDRSDPVANLNGGARYLRDLLTMFNNDLSLALAAYNAGENAVKRYGNTIPPYSETKNYVTRVKKLYFQYLQNS